MLKIIRDKMIYYNNDNLIILCAMAISVPGSEVIFKVFAV